MKRLNTRRARHLTPPSVLSQELLSTTLPPRPPRRSFQSILQTFKLIFDEIDRTILLRYGWRRLGERLAHLVSVLISKFESNVMIPNGSASVRTSKDSVFRLQSLLDSMLKLLIAPPRDRLFLLVHSIPSLRDEIIGFEDRVKELIEFYNLDGISLSNWQSEDEIDQKRDDSDLPRLFKLSLALKGPAFLEFIKSNPSTEINLDGRREEFIQYCLSKNPLLSLNGELSSPMSATFDLSKNAKRDSMISVITVEEVVVKVDKMQVEESEAQVEIKIQAKVDEALQVIAAVKGIEESVVVIEEVKVEGSEIPIINLPIFTTSAPTSLQPIATTVTPINSIRLSTALKHSSIQSTLSNLSIDTPPLTPLTSLFPAPPTCLVPSPGLGLVGFQFEISPPITPVETVSILPSLLLPAIILPSNGNEPKRNSRDGSASPKNYDEAFTGNFNSINLASRRRDSALSIGSLKSVIEEELDSDDDKNWKDLPIHPSTPLTGLKLKLANMKRRKEELDVKSKEVECLEAKREEEQRESEMNVDQLAGQLKNQLVQSLQPPIPIESKVKVEKIEDSYRPPLPPKSIFIQPRSRHVSTTPPRFPLPSLPFSSPPSPPQVFPTFSPSSSSSSSFHSTPTNNKTDNRSYNSTPNTSPRPSIISKSTPNSERRESILVITTPPRTPTSSLISPNLPQTEMPNTPPPRMAKSILRPKFSKSFLPSSLDFSSPSSSSIELENRSTGGSRPPLRLLSIEQGNPIEVLSALTNFLQESDLKPSDYFDGISSEGGNYLLAILLGKLKMTITESRDLFQKVDKGARKKMAEVRESQNNTVIGEGQDGKKWKNLLQKFDKVLTNNLHVSNSFELKDIGLQGKDQSRKQIVAEVLKSLIKDEILLDPKKGWSGCITVLDIEGTKFNSTDSHSTLHQLFTLSGYTSSLELSSTSIVATIDSSFTAYKSFSKVLGSSTFGVQELVTIGYGKGSKELINMSRRGHFELKRIDLERK